ncbi:putative phage replication initiation factor [Azoarcus olearius]|uniref:replication initiation factor domain-containing protein n=1 Tax=Azoarcus sp. (strain BH72) TaxID=418699 RepID=UPI0008060C95|nr:replication initiation factor domain-containing protein [Azoarcus olearius]ANQ85054.1 putative phage replication initiation factor [Azoarcus olearius]
MSTAFIDFLGVTFHMDPSNVKATIEILLRGWLGVETRIIETGKGWNGYAHRMDVEGVGLVAFGGNSNTVHIELTGAGCMQVKSWDEVADSLDLLEGRITRLDLAVDDFDGQYYSIDWCKQQYSDGGFKPKRGPEPKAHLWDDMGSGKGKTFYVGSRESGRLFRGYEKGKEQGDPDSNWFRLEVETRNRNREPIPTDAIRDPGPYFAGAYACLEHHDLEQRQIKTVRHVAEAHIRRTVEHARKQAGRAVHALLTLGHSVEEALAAIHVPQLPKKLVAPIRAFLALDESERTYTEVIAPAWARPATGDEIEELYLAMRLQRAPFQVGFGTNGRITRSDAAAPPWVPNLAATGV